MDRIKAMLEATQPYLFMYVLYLMQAVSHRNQAKKITLILKCMNKKLCIKNYVK